MDLLFIPEVISAVHPSVVTANYTLAFLKGAKDVHGLHMNYMGQVYTPLLCSAKPATPACTCTAHLHCSCMLTPLFFPPQWNERDAPKAYNDALRHVVGEANDDKVFEPPVTVLNRLPHYPGTAASADKQVKNA